MMTLRKISWILFVLEAALALVFTIALLLQSAEYANQGFGPVLIAYAYLAVPFVLLRGDRKDDPSRWMTIGAFVWLLVPPVVIVLFLWAISGMRC